MIDLKVSGYRQLEMTSKKHYSVAVTFDDADLIILNKIPKEDFRKIENNIETVIEHETLHIILFRFTHHSTSWLEGLHGFFGWMPKVKRRIGIKGVSNYGFRKNVQVHK